MLCKDLSLRTRIFAAVAVLVLVLIYWMGLFHEANRQDSISVLNARRLRSLRTAVELCEKRHQSSLRGESSSALHRQAIENNRRQLDDFEVLGKQLSAQHDACSNKLISLQHEASGAKTLQEKVEQLSACVASKGAEVKTKGNINAGLLTTFRMYIRYLRWDNERLLKRIDAATAAREKARRALKSAAAKEADQLRKTQDELRKKSIELANSGLSQSHNASDFNGTTDVYGVGETGKTSRTEAATEGNAGGDPKEMEAGLGKESKANAEADAKEMKEGAADMKMKADTAAGAEGTKEGAAGMEMKADAADDSKETKEGAADMKMKADTAAGAEGMKEGAAGMEMKADAADDSKEMKEGAADMKTS